MIRLDDSPGHIHRCCVFRPDSTLSSRMHQRIQRTQRIVSPQRAYECYLQSPHENSSSRLIRVVEDLVVSIVRERRASTGHGLSSIPLRSRSTRLLRNCHSRRVPLGDKLLVSSVHLCLSGLQRQHVTMVYRPMYRSVRYGKAFACVYGISHV